MKKFELSQYYLELNEFCAKKMKELRLKANPVLSQEQFAQKLGIDRGTLANYENGITAPPWWFICVVCKYFGKKLEDFCYFDSFDRKEK